MTLMPCLTPRRPARPAPRPAIRGGLALLLGVLLAGPAAAERADRGKPMTLESDKPCTVNLLRQTSICSGNVVVTQGTLVLRADKLELRETPEGYQVAVATGSEQRPAQYRQKRDGVDEYVEGQAQRIDYDGRNATIRFTGQAQVRRLRGAQAADEIQGSLITWDANTEQLNVQGGAGNAGNPAGRVRAVIAPRLPVEGTAGGPAGAAAPAASAPPSALKSATGLGERP